MVLIKLKVKGGLGNQLAQISFAYKILKQYKNSFLILDKNLYRKKIKRSFKLGKLVHKTNTFKFFLDELPISKIYNYQNKFSFYQNLIFFIHEFLFISVKWTQLFFKIFGISLKLKKIYLALAKIGLLTDDNRAYLDFDKSLIPCITITGYFQDINYHLNQKKELQELFLKEPSYSINNLLKGLDKNKKNASLLLRLNNDQMVDYDPRYFLDKSYKIISNLDESYNTIFFSDNQKKLISLKNKFPKPKFCNEKDPLIQLYIASRSSLFVLTSSSFAWWAYFLSDAKQKIVIKNKVWTLDNEEWSPGFSNEDKVFNII